MKSEFESYFVSLSRCSRKIGCNRAKTLRSFPSLEIGIEIVSFNTSVISNFGVAISFPKALERSTCVYRNWWHIISVHLCWTQASVVKVWCNGSYKRIEYKQNYDCLCRWYGLYKRTIGLEVFTVNCVLCYLPTNHYWKRFSSRRRLQDKGTSHR